MNVTFRPQGDFTKGCTIEAQGFESDMDAYKRLGVQVVGISVDNIDKHLDFSKKYGLDFPLLSDLNGVVSDKYGSQLDLGFIGKFSNRQTYIIGPDLKIKYVFTDVENRVYEHAQDVLAVLRNLLQPEGTTANADAASAGVGTSSSNSKAKSESGV